MAKDNPVDSPSESQGFICPICMEALRSAEALQVHWDAAHSGGDGASATNSKPVVVATHSPATLPK